MADDLLPKFASDSVRRFQSYILQQHRAGSERWPEARRLIQQAAEDLVEAAGPAGEERSLLSVATLLRVRFRFTEVLEEDARCGFMVPDGTGFHAVIAGSLRHHRSRFTLAHECGHALFYTSGGTRPQRLLPLSLGERLPRVREEGLCDSFAAAVVLPERILAPLAHAPVTVAGLLEVAARWNVAPETLFRRLLYDLGFCRDLTLYAISAPARQLDLVTSAAENHEPSLQVRRVFHGRGQVSKGAPTGPTIQRSLVPLGRSPVLDAIRSVFLSYSPHVDISQRGTTVWVAI